jgi:hypothetical protein
MSAYKIQMPGNYPEESIQEKGIVFFLLGESPASEFYVPTFQNTLSVVCTPPMKMEQTEY